MSNRPFRDFLEHCRSGNLDQVQSLLPSIDARQQKSLALRQALEEGQWEVAKELIPHSECWRLLSCAAAVASTPVLELMLQHNPEHNTIQRVAMALGWAMRKENRTNVDFLWDICKNHPDALRDNGILAVAAQTGRVDLVRILLNIPHSPQRVVRAISAAAMHGQHQCVQILFPHMTPAGAKEGIKMAARYGHADIVNTFLPTATSTNKREASEEAAGQRQWSIVRDILAQTKPNFRYAAVLNCALRDNATDVALSLFPHVDVNTLGRRSAVHHCIKNDNLILLEAIIAHSRVSRHHHPWGTEISEALIYKKWEAMMMLFEAEQNIQVRIEVIHELAQGPATHDNILTNVLNLLDDDALSQVYHSIKLTERMQQRGGRAIAQHHLARQERTQLVLATQHSVALTRTARKI